MQAHESRVVPIAAVMAVLIVSLTIVGLACWSGDAAGPWAATTFAVPDERGVGAQPLAPEARPEGEVSAVAGPPHVVHAARGGRAGDGSERAWVIVAPARSDAE